MLNEEVLLNAEPVFNWGELTIGVIIFAVIVVTTILLTDKSRDLKDRRRDG